MSSHHTSAAFRNTCVKTPVNPNTNLPSPSYEKNREKNILQSDYVSRENGKAGYQCSETSVDSIDKTVKENKATMRSESVKSLLDFYESIPDYGDVNHLSNREFYSKLNNLKIKQKLYLENEKNNYSEPKWIDLYQDNQKINSPYKNSARKSSSKSWSHHQENETLSDGSIPSQTSNIKIDKRPRSVSPTKRTVRIENRSNADTVDSLSSSVDYLIIKNVDKNKKGNPNGKKKTPNSPIKNKNSNPGYQLSDPLWDDYQLDFCPEYFSESEYDLVPEFTPPVSSKRPAKSKQSVAWKDNGVTIPKPFKMTIRDEEDRIIDELLYSTEEAPKESKPKLFKANPIPIESRVPLFDQIMANQERRREIVKLNSKIALQSQVKPFSFTKREEEISSLKRLLSKSKSSPQLQRCEKFERENLRVKPFKAKPPPRNLYSNYFYHKMREDEFYRALKKKIRAEELLRVSSLPPSMAARERDLKNLKELNSNSDDCDLLSDKCARRLFYRKVPNYKQYHEQLEKEFEEMRNEFITTSPQPYKLRSAKRGEKRMKQHRNVCTRAHEGSENPRARSALELQSVNRSNLAAVLRIQSAKKRIEDEMKDRLEEERRKEEMRWRTKLTRRRPAWQAINYNHEEDLAMRLQMRRDEERLRHEEHQHQMELMLGRVQQIPTLFERQTQLLKRPQSRKELLNELYGNLKNKNKLKSEADSDSENIDKLIEQKFQETLNITNNSDSAKQENQSSEEDYTHSDTESKNGEDENRK